MRKSLFSIFLFSFLSLCSYGQQSAVKNTYLKVSGGRVSFGTGDFLGYAVSFDLSKNVLNQSRWALHELLLGAEFIFEDGVKNPVIENPTFEEFISKSFRHTSNAVLWPKVSYYPLKKVLKGFNIQAGPTVGYSNRSYEYRATRVVDNSGNAVRQSYLGFDNEFTVGYRISTGIEFYMKKRMQAGVRMDFSNNNKGEINTMLGLKFGYRL
jgi:hypothetical protein